MSGKESPPYGGLFFIPIVEVSLNTGETSLKD